MTRTRTLDFLAQAAGLYVRSYSPGDGATRYRFFRMDPALPESEYFGPESGIYTALGYKEAETFLRGAMAGKGK